MIIEVIQHQREMAEKNIREIISHYDLSASDFQIESFMQFYDYNGFAETVLNVVAWCTKIKFNDNSESGLFSTNCDSNVKSFNELALW